MPKIITFSTYPIDTPRHGGQIRTAAISSVLKSNGWVTKHFCVYNSHDYPDVAPSEWNFSFGHDVAQRLVRSGGRPDVDVCDHLLESQSTVVEISKLIESFSPDLIMLEQPWLWPLVKAVLKEICADIPIVYSSQNHEVDLLRQLLGDASTSEASRLIEKAQRIESDLIGSSSGLVCVSEADVAKLATSEIPSVVAPNGVWSHAATAINQRLPKNIRNMNYALFVGSAHPPNSTGFDKMLRPVRPKMHPDHRIVVVGGVCHLLKGAQIFCSQPGLAETRIELLGMQTNSQLELLLSHAKVILLPITEGGGTNLKTAEALYNRLPIVATSAAFRGFERFKTFPNVIITDNPIGFSDAVVELLSRSPSVKSYSDKHLDELETLTWPRSLQKLPIFLSRRLKDKVAIPTLTFGNDRTFSGEELERLGVFGWHSREEVSGAIWSAEKIACISFDSLSKLEKTYTFEIEAALYNPEDRHSEVKILSASRLLCHRMVDSQKLFQMQFDVAAQDFYEDGKLEIFVMTSILTSPASRGYGDVRMLGLNLIRLTIKSPHNDESSVRPEGGGHNSAGVSGSLDSATSYTKLQKPGNIETITHSVVSAITSSRKPRLQLDTLNDIVVDSGRIVILHNSEFRTSLMRGWASPPRIKNAIPFERILLQLKKGNISIPLNTEIVDRPDVAIALHNPTMKRSGFEAQIPSGLEAGTYRIEFIGWTRSGRQYLDTSRVLQVD